MYLAEQRRRRLVDARRFERPHAEAVRRGAAVAPLAKVAVHVLEAHGRQRDLAQATRAREREARASAPLGQIRLLRVTAPQHRTTNVARLTGMMARRGDSAAPPDTDSAAPLSPTTDSWANPGSPPKGQTVVFDVCALGSASSRTMLPPPRSPPRQGMIGPTHVHTHLLQKGVEALWKWAHPAQNIAKNLPEGSYSTMVFLKVDIRTRVWSCVAYSDSLFLPAPTPQLVLAHVAQRSRSVVVAIVVMACYSTVSRRRVPNPISNPNFP